MKSQKLHKKRIPWWLDTDFFIGYWKKFTTRQARRRGNKDLRQQIKEILE